MKKNRYCLKISFLSHLQEIFFFKLLNAKTKSIIAKIASGILVYSKVAKYVKTPLEKPKKINKNAGKQQSVDKSAVVTALIITNLSFFIIFLVKSMYMKML